MRSAPRPGAHGGGPPSPQSSRSAGTTSPTLNVTRLPLSMHLGSRDRARQAARLALRASPAAAPSPAQTANGSRPCLPQSAVEQATPCPATGSRGGCRLATPRGEAVGDPTRLRLSQRQPRVRRGQCLHRRIRRGCASRRPGLAPGPRRRRPVDHAPLPDAGRVGVDEDPASSDHGDGRSDGPVSIPH